MASTNQYRTTSSNYRFPAPNLNNFLLPSSDKQFHAGCIPKETKERVKSAPPRSKDSRSRDYTLCNEVGEDQKWMERCRKERSIQKAWESKFSFLTEFDQKGDPRTKLQRDETNVSQFSRKYPPSMSQHLGKRVQSAPAQRMLRLEMTMHRGKRKNKDLIHCD